MLQIKGYLKRDKLALERTAWQTAWLLNALIKDAKFTVDDLLVSDRKPKLQTVDEQVQIAELWVAALGGTDNRQKGVH
jgi:hypothetical protein